MKDPTHEASAGRPADRLKLNLIRSIAGHAEGREADALAEIQAALDGATLEELAALRTGRSNCHGTLAPAHYCGDCGMYSPDDGAA